MFLALLVVPVALYLGWSFPFARTMTYRFRHDLGIELASAAVNFTQHGTLVRGTTFMYHRGPDKGPASQDHEVRLAPGPYDAVFVLEYLNGDRKEFTVPVTVSRFAFGYTIDLDEKKQ